MRFSHAAAGLAAAVFAPVLAAGEVTRTLRLDHAPSPGRRFVVENLVGSMSVIPGSGSKVEVEATVHAESGELADRVRLEQVRGETGEPVLRVLYPLEDYRHYRSPGAPPEEEGSVGSFLGRLFGGGGTTTTYLGRRVKIGGHGGVLLYADVEVRLPRGGAEGTLRNIVGPIHGRDVEGNLTFDASSADIRLERVRGVIAGDTGSGDIEASDVTGSFTCDTGSGDCELTGFDGEDLTCDTGSGDVKIREARARTIHLDTGSGSIEAVGVDAEEIDADTGSGDVSLEMRGGRLLRVHADTGSGDVTLRLPPDAGFEAMASRGSGDLVVRFDGAEPILRRRELVGFRRGDARVRIEVETGSGDCVIEPIR